MKVLSWAALAVALCLPSAADAGAAELQSLSANVLEAAPAQYVHGHWDVYYYYWTGHCWTTIFYGAYPTVCQANQAVFLLQNHYGYSAWTVLHY